MNEVRVIIHYIEQQSILEESFTMPASNVQEAIRAVSSVANSNKFFPLEKKLLNVDNIIDFEFIMINQFGGVDK